MITSQGYVCSLVGGRARNEDSHHVDNMLSLYVVADGVGGGVRGDEASKLAVSSFVKAVTEGQSLERALLAAQESVFQESIRSFGEPIMGTTFTAVQIRADSLSLVHVGDSRCYIYEESCLRLVTKDHESFDDMLQGAVLTSYLGMDTNVQPMQVQKENIPLKSQTGILLSTDGLHRQLSDIQILQLIRNCEHTPEQLPENLCHEAEKQPDSDNVTVIYVTVIN